MRTLSKRFALAQNGVAAIEFALLLPLLILMMLGSVELQRYMRIKRQLSLAAENIAAIVAQRQSSDLTKLNFDFDAAYHLFPPAREAADWNWPSYDTGFGLGNMRRQCGTLNGAATGATATGANIPAAMFGPGSVVIVDLGYRFTPLFGSSLIAPIDLFRQGYANARFATPYINFPNQGLTVRCTGY